MKRVSLRLRLTVMTSLLLAVCCMIVNVCLMNSAVLKMDSIEAGAMSIYTDENTDIILDLSLSDIFPEISEKISKTKADFLWQSILLTILVIIVGSASTWILSKYALEPIRQLSQQVEDTTEHNLDQPLEIPATRDEVALLAETFNNMRSRLNQAFLSQKQFSANAAHELRTPLAILQTSLEVFGRKERITQKDYEEMFDLTQKQVERMNRLVNTLLEFQSMHTAEKNERIFLSELMEEVLCDLGPLADEKQMIFDEISVSDEHPVCGNSVLLYRAIYNLVENAVKYGKESSHVRVAIKEQEAQMAVHISDQGTGIAKEQQEIIFDAFYRIDKSRSRKLGGAGLGLAMVKEIVTLHSGTVFVEKSDENGTTMCMLLP